MERREPCGPLRQICSEQLGDIKTLRSPWRSTKAPESVSLCHGPGGPRELLEERDGVGKLDGPEGPDESLQTVLRAGERAMSVIRSRQAFRAALPFGLDPGRAPVPLWFRGLYRLSMNRWSMRQTTLSSVTMWAKPSPRRRNVRSSRDPRDDVGGADETAPSASAAGTPSFPREGGVRIRAACGAVDSFGAQGVSPFKVPGGGPGRLAATLCPAHALSTELPWTCSRTRTLS